MGTYFSKTPENQQKPAGSIHTQMAALAQEGQTSANNPIQKKANQGATGLPDNLRAGIENLSGYTMEDVKVHYNSDKPAQLQAHAYAQGTDIHLAPGQEKHLPHEAWHVAQQKQGRVRPTMQMKDKVNINDDVALEKEADVMGAKAMSSGSKPNVTRQLHSKGTSEQNVQLSQMNPVMQMVDDTEQEERTPFEEIVDGVRARGYRSSTSIVRNRRLNPWDREQALMKEIEKLEKKIKGFETELKKLQGPAGITKLARKTAFRNGNNLAHKITGKGDYNPTPNRVLYSKTKMNSQAEIHVHQEILERTMAELSSVQAEVQRLNALSITPAQWSQNGYELDEITNPGTYFVRDMSRNTFEILYKLALNTDGNRVLNTTIRAFRGDINMEDVILRPTQDNIDDMINKRYVDNYKFTVDANMRVSFDPE